jgi:uncharacterized delta-60 repeat protein
MWPFFSRKSSKHACPVSSRPRLEPLEDRCLLAGGVLDPTFGSGGLLTTAVGASSSFTSAVATYPHAGTANDGKIVVAGESYVHGPKATLVRYNLDGTLDNSFGSGGVVAQAAGQALDVKIQADGKLVVAVLANNDFGVIRYNADGTLDRTFGGKGGNGEVITDVNGKSNDQATKLLLQSDGKIVVAGWTAARNTENYDLALVRYNTDGTLDTTYGQGGKVIQHFTSPIYSDTIHVAIDPGATPLDPNAGKIVALVDIDDTHDTQVLVRFNTNGSLDTSFAGAGYATISSQIFPGGVNSVVVQPDDRIVLAGFAAGDTSTGYDLALERYNANGTLDTTFGSGGIVVMPMPGDQFGQSLILQSDGKIIVAGNQDYYNFLVARFNGADGSPDAAFGVNGIAVSGNVENPYQPGFVITGSEPVKVALEPDGRIVVAGSHDYHVTGNYSIALARFLAAGPQIGSFTASPNPVTVGSDLTLIASNITDANPGATITQVTFYLDSNGDRELEPGTDTVLGYGIQTSSGTWTVTFTVNLAPGTYTLFGQAEDSYGVNSVPLALSLGS